MSKPTHRLKYTCSGCGKTIALTRTDAESVLAYEQKALSAKAAHRGQKKECANATFTVNCEVVG